MKLLIASLLAVASFASNDKQKNVMTWCKKETGVEE